MSFSQENGYQPETFDQIMDAFMANVNDIFDNNYNTETFRGSGWFKYLYGPAQKAAENETKTSEIFLKLQSYIASVNQKINAPSVAYNGIIAAFKAAGYKVGLKPIEDADAGKAFICADVDDGADDYADVKLEICQLIQKHVIAGVVSQGDQVESLPIGNGQNFDFKFSLPDRTDIKVRATIVISENNSLSVPSTEEINQAIFDNVQALYQVGLNFEPQRYFNQTNAPWAESVLLEWSDDNGANWYDTVFEAEFDDKLELTLGNVSTVIS